MDPNQNQPPQPAPNQEPTPPTPNQNPFAQPSTDALSPTPPAPASVPSVVQPTLSPNPIVPTPQTSTPTNPGPITPFVSDPRQTAAAQPTVFFSKDPVVAQPPKKSKKKRILIATGTTIAVFALASAAVFGLYLPNTEANVWKTGLNRTGDAMHKLVVSSTEVDKIESYKSSELTGSFSANISGAKISGDIASKFDPKRQDGSLNVAVEDGENSQKQSLSAKLITDIPKGKTLPDIFFQASGISTLGVDSFVPGISDYEGKWISIDSTYLESLAPQTGELQKADIDSISAKEVSELATAISESTKEYLFSADEQKAVFEKKEFIGKEKTDGINTYHYKVGINAQNAEKYCVALVESVSSTDAYKKILKDSQEDIEKTKKDAEKDCKDETKKIKSSDTFDLWIDGKYKLIHKVRVHDKENKDSYVDIGQTYKGGDEISLFLAFKDSKNKVDGKFTLGTNTKTNETKAEIVANGGEDSNKYDVKINLEIKPLKDGVEINRPEGAISIQELLSKFNQTQSAQPEEDFFTQPEFSGLPSEEFSFESQL